eukprot:1341656-Pyramimonas_sp.AAC.1
MRGSAEGPCGCVRIPSPCNFGAPLARLWPFGGSTEGPSSCARMPSPRRFGKHIAHFVAQGAPPKAPAGCLRRTYSQARSNRFQHKRILVVV